MRRAITFVSLVLVAGLLQVGGADAAPADRFALSQSANSSYKRLTRTIDVPAGGATLSFWVDQTTEEFWDFFFVEAHTPGQDDWTTLPDLNGHSTQVTPLGFVPEEHPFLLHYLTCDVVFQPCDPDGTTGEWWANSGANEGYEEWTVDLSAWSGETVELSFALETDFIFPFHGVFLDDVEVSTGEGAPVLTGSDFRYGHRCRESDVDRSTEGRGVPVTETHVARGRLVSVSQSGVGQ